MNSIHPSTQWTFSGHDDQGEDSPCAVAIHPFGYYAAVGFGDRIRLYHVLVPGPAQSVQTYNKQTTDSMRFFFFGISPWAFFFFGSWSHTHLSGEGPEDP